MMVGGTVVEGTWVTAILFGVSSAMLGVSGFESSSQFVEEQAKGVFVKTLRNMQVSCCRVNGGSVGLGRLWVLRPNMCRLVPICVCWVYLERYAS